MLSIETGNSPVQPPADIFSSPFNTGGAELLDMFVRLESWVVFENGVNVFAGVTSGVPDATDFIWPAHPATRQPATTRKRSRIFFMVFHVYSYTAISLVSVMKIPSHENILHNTLVEPVLLKYIVWQGIPALHVS
jgi:hypothetical protein